MSFNLTGGNPRAHRIRVYFEGNATILEGMPVCYNYDTTDNWSGGSMAATGEVTETGTTAEGSSNEGKYIRVELPADNNLVHFAGVVAKGSPGIGKAGPSPVDIYVPNGAIVPVLCDVDTTAGVTVLAIQVGEEELGRCGSGLVARNVAIAMETETTLDVTAATTLAVLDPNRFIYQDLDGTALSLGAGSDTVIGNHINLTYAGTGGGFEGLRVTATNTGAMAASGGSCAILAYLACTGGDTSAAATYTRTILSQLVLSGTINNGGAILCAGHFQTGGAPTLTAISHCAALYCEYGITTDGGGESEVIALVNGNATNLDQIMYINGANTATYLFTLDGEGGGLFSNSDGGVSTKKIKIKVNGTDYYLMVSDG